MLNSTPQTGLVAARPVKADGSKRGRTRRQILEESFRLIGHEDGLSVRIEEICAAAGVSRGTFYNYFNSLDDLFQTLARELTHDFNQVVIASLQEIESWAERTNAAIQHYLRRAHQDPAWAWAMVHLSARGPIFGAECTESCIFSMQNGIAGGEFDLPDARTGTDLYMGTMLACTISALRGHASSRTQPRLVAQYLLRALGVEASRARIIAEQPLPRLRA